MNSERTNDIVIGAGIIGLAHAYQLAKRGRSVVVIERGQTARGASIRNFGMIWPVGQRLGENRDLALRSRDIWKIVVADAGIWHRQTGSLHLAYEEDELAVLEEFVGQASGQVEAPTMVSPHQALKISPVNETGLLGGMWSESEVCVDPREAVALLPGYLERQFGVRFEWFRQANAIDGTTVLTSNGSFSADHIWVCTGDDFHTLYPEIFAESKLYRTMLQMMRTDPRPDFQIGTMLAAGLTLTHYKAFENCPSLQALRDRLDRESPWFDDLGIHVMASQHGTGEITLGDSHDYEDFGPFHSDHVDSLILKYLKTFLEIPELKIAYRWQGTYCKHPQDLYFAQDIADAVTIVTGVGGAGMTLSFGLAEKMVTDRLGGEMA